MYRTILIPLDGSPFAEQALPLAIALARQTRAALRLVHVRGPDAAPPPDSATRDSATRDSDSPDEPYPRPLARLITAEAGIAAEAVILEGTAVDELVAYVTREGIELACIATHGRGGIQRARLGSTADALIRALEIPIVTKRPAEGRAGPVGAQHLTTHEPIEHVLVPLDGSPLAESVLGHVAALDDSALQVSFVQAIPAPVPNDPASLSLVLTTDQSTLDAEASRGLAYLDSVAERFSRYAQRVETAVLLEPQPLNAILDYVDQHEVDLIAIATHGRGGVKRLALGSMADRILRSAIVPVLVFRPGEP